MYSARPFARASTRAALLAAALLTLAAAPAHAADPASDDGGETVAADASEPTLRDPLRPPGYGAAASAPEQQQQARFDASAWRLASTLVARERRAAIINGRNVREGGRVGGATVVEIESGRVTLDYRGRRFTIRNPTPSVRVRERAGERNR